MRKKGVTIIELVIYMSILSVLLLFFTDMFATLVNKQLETESLSNVQQDANYLLSRFTYDFARASSVSSPASPGAPVGSLQLVIDTIPYSFTLSSGNVIEEHSGNQYNLNSSETTISNLSFQRLGIGNTKDVVQIKFDITSNVKQQAGYDVTHFSTTLGIREK